MQITPPEAPLRRVPEHLRPALMPVAGRVFWWGDPEEWLNNVPRFAAQVMTFGDLDDVALVQKLLGDAVFEEVLENPPPGVFDVKSWSFWHCHYRKVIPPLPVRKL